MLDQAATAGGEVDLAARSRLSFAIGRVGGTVVVTVRGEVDRTGVQDLAGVLRDLIDNQGNGTVVVDLRDVAGADPSLVEVFSAASDWARRHGARFSVHDPPATLAPLLSSTLEVARRAHRPGDWFT